MHARAQAFESAQIASTQLQTVTGVVYTHLHRTSDIQRKAQLIDVHGQVHICKPDRMEFIIQKKAVVGFATIQELIQQEQFDLAVERLVGFLELVKERCQKGFADRDLQIFKNFGFVDDQPVEIDVGDFKVDARMKDPANWRGEVIHISRELLEFLRKHAPQLVPQFEARRDEVLQ